MTPPTKYTVIWRTREINNRVYEVAHPSDMETINCTYTPIFFVAPGSHFSLCLYTWLLLSFARQC